jgi:hypothetical protein
MPHVYGWKEVLFIAVHIGMRQLKTHTLKYNNHSPDRDREEKEEGEEVSKDVLLQFALPQK